MRPRTVVVLVVVAAVAVLAVTTPVRVVAIPLVLALFPAALLAPGQRWLRAQGVPAAIGSLLLTTGALTVIVLAGAIAVPLMVADLPRLIDSLSASLRGFVGALEATPIGVEFEGIDALLERGGAFIRDSGDPVAQASAAFTLAGEVLTGAVLTVVILFFYLKDGERLAVGVRDGLPPGWRSHAEALGVRSWETLGTFFRGQLLIAVVDAVFIGIGLLVIGVPLALPLALLVLLGGLLPIVGAIASGAVAVLVATADGGLVIGLVTLGLVVGVQQLESNLLQPVIMGRLTALHPLVVILVITLGWVLLGVLGAFLAVPIAACVARGMSYWREERPVLAV